MSMPNNKRFSWRLDKADLVKLILSCVFISTVLIPLIRMFSYIDGESIRTVVSSAGFATAVSNSLVSASLGTILSVALALLLAFSTQRTKIRGKQLFEVIVLLPMLIPSISCGMGLVILLGNNGILTRLFHMPTALYGLPGIVLGSIICTFPVAYLMLADVLRYEDGSAYEAAAVLGIPKWRQFFSITLPYLRKPLVSTVFAVFAMIITDYGVPLITGGKYSTVAIVMYQEVIGQLNFDKGAVYGALLLIPAVIAFIVDTVNKERAKSVYVSRSCPQSNRLIAKTGSYICCIVMSLVALLPIMSFILLMFAADYPNDLSFTFSNIARTFQLNAGQYLVNSVVIALGTAVIGTAVAFMTAYMSARMKSGVSRILHLAAMTSAAIPGIVLGLAYVLTFSKTALYGTLLILMTVNMVHFIASPYLMMYNSLSKINENLEGVAHTMAISRGRMIMDVFIPQCRSTLLEMFSYFFVNCMMTISAVSFLATTSNKPVSLMITQFEAQMQLECAATVSLMILVVNILIKMIGSRLSSRAKKAVS